MEGYLGEQEVDWKTIESFKDYTCSDWAMYFISSYGQIDGDHHRLWVLDQVARILKGSPIKCKIASWDNGETEYRISVGDPSDEYTEWVHWMVYDGESSPQYGYDEGIPP